MRKQNKVTSLLLMLVFVINVIFPNLALAETSDVRGHWAEEQISKWLSLGLVTGYQDGTFKPNNNVTRAEYFTMINKAFGFMEEAKINFKDVAPNSWYASQIAKAARIGYISGYEDGTIRPNNLISRQEAAVILARILQLNTNQTSILSMFEDESQIPPWSKAYIGAVASEGYLRGYEDKTFKASNPITRAEAVTMLNKALGELFYVAGIYGPDTGTETISGNVTITAHDVTLRNMLVKGNLYITEGVGQGDVTLENVVVTGKTLVKGGGENRIRIVNSTLGETIINKSGGQVRLVALGDSKIGLVIVNSGAKLEEDGVTSEGFSEVTIIELPADSLIEFNGDFEFISVEAQGANIRVAGGSVAKLEVAKSAAGGSVDLAGEAKVESFTANAPLNVTGKGAITQANINSDGVTTEQTPGKINLGSGVKEGTYGEQKASDLSSGSSGSGGGGGGSGGSGGSGDSGGNSGGGDGGNGGSPDGGDTGGGTLPKTLTVTSTAFTDGGTIPLEYSRYGDNKNLPLKWNQVAGATEYALLMYDEDATDEEYGPFIHWAVTGIKDLNNILNGSKQYKNWFGEVGYGGPQPPPWHIPHKYTIEVYALNGSVNLEDDEWGILKADFDNALKGKVITKAQISGTFGLEVLNATLEATGEVAIKSINFSDGEFDFTWDFIGKEYSLKYEGEVISLADTNMQDIFLFEESSDFYGHQEPSEESNLWIPILELISGSYQCFAVSKQGKVYHATLEWNEPTKADVAFYGPEDAEEVFTVDEEDLAVIDFSKVTPDKLHNWSTEEDPNYYAVGLRIINVDLSETNVKKAFRIYDDGTIIEPTISDDLDVQYVTTKWEPGYVTMIYVLNDDTIHFAEFYVESLTPFIPQVSNVTFTDTDSETGRIAGTISWSKPSEIDYLTEYEIYFVDWLGEPIKLIARVAVGVNNYAISPIQIPDDAVNIGVVSVAAFGKSPITSLLEFIDNGSNSSPPKITSVTDSDTNPGIDGRDFTVNWDPVDWAYENSTQEIYILPTAIVLTSQNVAQFNPVAEIDDKIGTWTGDQNLTEGSDGEKFTEQEYNVYVIAHNKTKTWIWLSNNWTFAPDNDITPYIVEASTFADSDGKLYSFLIWTNRPINDESVVFEKFKIDGVSATGFDQGISTNDEWFWINFDGNYSTDELPTLTVDAGAFQDRSNRWNIKLTDVNVVDGAKPILKSAEVDGDVLTLTFSEELDQDYVPDELDFEVMMNDTLVNVTNVEIDDGQVILTLAQGSVRGDVVTISYTSSGNDYLQDMAGNKVDNFKEGVKVVTPETIIEEMFIQSIELLPVDEDNQSEEEDVSDPPILNEDEQEEGPEELDGENDDLSDSPIIIEDDEEEEEQEPSEEETATEEDISEASDQDENDN